MEDISTNIKERVLQIAERKGLAKEAFLKNIGATYGNFKGKSKESALSSDVLAEISTVYPDVNIYWLLTGKGDVFNRALPATVSVAQTWPQRGDGPRDEQSIPLYDVTATAGIVDLLHANAQKHIPIDYIVIPNLPKCDGALPITGDSMYPLLKSGDIALYKEVNDFQNIIWGEMYLIALAHNGDNFFFAKFIQKAERPGYIKLVSQNRHHQDVEFPQESITALAIIKASVRINTGF